MANCAKSCLVYKDQPPRSLPSCVGDAKGTGITCRFGCGVKIGGAWIDWVLSFQVGVRIWIVAVSE